jgi:hypothetical protein
MINVMVDNIDMAITSASRATALVAVLATLACSPARVEPPPTSTGASTETVPPQQQPSGSEPGCGMPTLRVLSPPDGARVTTPFPITYETECFSPAHDGTIYFATDGIRVDLHPQTSDGTLTVPDQPLLSGRRTVTIQLTNAHGQPLDNPEATTVITITIEGSRDAG